MLKQRPSAEVSAPAAAPTWGTLAPEGETATVVRFVVGDRSVSFPYHAFKRWELSGSPEQLTIQIDREVVTVHGQDLAVVRDALDAARLLILRVKAGRAPVDPKAGTVVTSITFAPVKPNPERSAGVQD